VKALITTNHDTRTASGRQQKHVLLVVINASR